MFNTIQYKDKECSIKLFVLTTTLQKTGARKATWTMVQHMLIKAGIQSLAYFF